MARLRSAAGRHASCFLELFALTGLVVAQPLLDVLGRSPDFLLFRQVGARDVLLLAIAVTVLPALALALLEGVVGLLGPAPRRRVHLLVIAALIGLFALEIAKKATPARGPALVGLAALAAVGGAWLSARGPAVRLWLRLVSPAPIVFLALFLLVSPAGKLVVPRSATTGQHAGAAAAGGQGPIVILVLDELPLRSLLDAGGHVDGRLYPSFAKLAAGSTWYRNATGVSGLTKWAMPAMLTGRYPERDGIPIAAEYPDNLLTLLGDAYGYQMSVHEGVTRLCPPATCPIAARSDGPGGLGRVARDAAHVWAQIVSPVDAAVDPAATLEEATVAEAGGTAGQPAPRQDQRLVTRPASLERFLSSITPADRPTVHFLHILMPHQPWRYLPSGLKYPERPVGDPSSSDGTWTTEPWPVASTHQRHLMQLAYTDRLLGSVLERLHVTGLYDRSLLLVTADHGMAFTPGRSGRLQVSTATAPDILWVPLFIKRPLQRAPSTTDVNWEHVDLVPTIADIAGFKVPWRMDGVSWADPSVAARSRTQKWFSPFPGARRAFDGPAGQAAALRGVTDRLLRPGAGYLGWFAFGPHADLVGKRVGEMTAAQGGGTARVIGLDDYGHVDPAAGTVPAHVGGTLTAVAPGMPRRPAVVAAVNGVIGGVSETFAAGGGAPAWFSAMVPDSLLRAGRNRLELFLLDDAGGRRRLRPLTLTR
jgi:arylsulfatase A-like enzyme